MLADPSIGGFTVDTAFNRSATAVREQIEGFFADRKPDDLLLLYFSCHGVLDSRGRLSFVAADTKKERLDATGISARWVAEQMNQSRSQCIVLLLDCCYSGAFSGGLRRRSAGVEEISEQLGGRGRVVITASDKLEYAYGSEFTNAVVRGLETGAADLDGDGRVAVGELYQYVYDHVRLKNPGQTPTMSADGMRGQLYLATNPQAASPLPDILRRALESQELWERLWAIDGLTRLLTSDAPGGQKKTARRELLRLRDTDTDPDIQALAGEAFHTGAPPPPLPTDRRIQRKHRLMIGGLAISMAVAGTIATASNSTRTAALTSTPCSPSTRLADGVLSLGTLLPNTGEYVYAGPALNAGVQLAMKDINDGGGIPRIADVKLDPINQKDEGDPSRDTASRSIDELLANQVDVIIGPATSAVGLKVIDKATCAGVILFSPTNTAQAFTTYPDRGLYFRTSPPAAVEGIALGKLVVGDGNSTVVVMSRDDAAGNDLREATAAAIRKSGVRVLDSFHYDQNATDHTKDIQRAMDKHPDAIVLIGFSESTRIMASMIQKGLDPKRNRIYGSSANMTNSLASQVDPKNPGVLAGMRGTQLGTGDKTFARRLGEIKFGLQDQNHAAQAYDAVVVTALAAAVAGTDAPNAIAREINGVTRDGEKCYRFDTCMALVKDHKNIAYVGPSGPLEFSNSGEPRSATYFSVEIQNDGTVKILGKS
ncbi:MAG TPA: ABC transporter substrate-binding protein [Pseudonocardiaceae bacterium]|nr:ABC transporter substrate-binding protein [Pseudonocardiaceae bacterium]